ncbi:MAG: thiamine-monophosphate kinase [Verrucomicrobia bacterium]|nr:thiamine-monophosphate kinase [Verrucomicrobiota bacterium]
MKTLRQIGERGLIQRLQRLLPRGQGVVVGIGDDCAALRFGAGGKHGDLLLLKTDAVVEGVHFARRATPRQIGWKAMARALSDIAAMAGRPRWALVTAGLREGLPVRFVEDIYRGMAAVAREFGVAIVGGETVRTRGPLWLSIALAGEAGRRAMRLRSGARVGDAIFVTGSLGGSIAGKHLAFTPRIREAQWLARRGFVRAMIDISDGLVRDLGHVCRESRVGARLMVSAIPIAPAAGGSLARALGDGEDFELLFTTPARDAERLMRAWQRAFPRLSLTQIGIITRAKGIRLRDDTGQSRPLHENGYDHFTPSHA